VALGRLDRPEEAEAAYRRAIALHPEEWAGYSWLGAHYARLARYEDALAMFARVVALDSLNARGWRNLGVAYGYLDRPREARDAFRRSLLLRPDATAFSNLASLLYYERRFPEAATNYARALELRPEDFRLWGNSADCARHLPGQAARADSFYREAIRLAERALEVDPSDALVHGFLAEYRARVGDRAASRSELARSLAAAPGDPEIAFVAAIVEEALGERERAVRHAQDALDRGYSPVELRSNPDLAGLRGDPRLAKFMPRAGG
jgi:tetratricopeptide (TPR) repeat protein